MKIIKRKTKQVKDKKDVVGIDVLGDAEGVALPQLTLLFFNSKQRNVAQM